MVWLTAAGVSAGIYPLASSVALVEATGAGPPLAVALVYTGAATNDLAAVGNRIIAIFRRTILRNSAAASYRRPAATHTAHTAESRISLDAAAGRREAERGIDNVHASFAPRNSRSGWRAIRKYRAHAITHLYCLDHRDKYSFEI